MDIQVKVKNILRKFIYYLILLRSPLFSRKYYLENNPDVATLGLNALYHYVFYGAYEGRSPHPLFNAKYYLKRNPDVASMKINPLIHYLRHGIGEGRKPHPLFDRDYYFMKNKIETKSNPLVHYLKNGLQEKSDPHPLFEARFYLQINPDVVDKSITPLQHFIQYGQFSGAITHSIFAMQDQNSDVKVKYQTSQGADFVGHIRSNDVLRQSLAEYLREGNFEVADNLYRRTIRVSPLQDERKIATTFAEVESMRAGIDNKGTLVHSEKQPEWVLNVQTSNDKITLMPPEEYIGIVKNVSIIGGTRLILDHQGKVYHDEIAWFSHPDYGIKPWQHIFLHPDKTAEIFNTKVCANNVINEGILISCDHEKNYFHWFVECLPKILLLKKYTQFDGTPLLIGKNLHPNFIKGLEKLTKGKYPIFYLDEGTIYEVKKLIYPSDLSRLLDRYNGAFIPDKDTILSEKWIRLVKDELMGSNNLFASEEKCKRKLYLTRRSATYRKVLNEEEIEIELLRRGFEIVDLAKCSFEYQLELFSQAQLVVAPTGATVTNMLFAPSGTKFIVFVSDHEGMYFNLWEQLASICGISLECCSGPRAFNVENLHDDYTIPIEALLNLID
jgi:hypothetical protein